MPASDTPSAVIVGGGHNALVAATLLARAGLRTTLLERLDHVGGAAVSERAFPGVDVRLSRYAYLVSVFPDALARELGIDLRRHRPVIDSYTPRGTTGLLIDRRDTRRTSASLELVTGDPRAGAGWHSFYDDVARFCNALSPTLLGPLPSRAQARALVGDDELWRALVEQPIGEVLEAAFPDDLVRGVVLTDALIGSFTSAHDPSLLQNRCFFYHLVGGAWDVPLGGMGAISGALEEAARAAGAELRTNAEVVAIDSDGTRAVVTCADGSRIETDHVLCGAAPAVLDRLLGRESEDAGPEGSQLKINMILERLPRLRDRDIDPREAFTGTFHANEGAAQLQRAYEQAAAGLIPDLPPCETYCHSLSDPSIVAPELRERDIQTLTLFGLHMPARLFMIDHDARKEEAVRATLASLNAVLDEPIEDCLLRAPDGSLCLEARTPVELERELGLPGGNIFHRDLQWPFAEDESEIGHWGTETDLANVWVCGAGARRGGAISGIPGHNAALAVLEALENRRAAAGGLGRGGATRRAADRAGGRGPKPAVLAKGK